MGWRTAADAEEDLQHIAERGLLNFGEVQTRAYIADFIEMFAIFAANPELAPERQTAKGSVRLHRYRSHHILYEIDDGNIVILRVLHGLQNWFDLL